MSDEIKPGTLIAGHLIFDETYSGGDLSDYYLYENNTDFPKVVMTVLTHDSKALKAVTLYRSKIETIEYGKIDVYVFRHSTVFSALEIVGER